MAEKTYRVKGKVVDKKTDKGKGDRRNKCHQYIEIGEKMMKYSNIMIASILLLLLSGCTSTLLFNADFDTDPLGGLPNSSPPGDPVGDSIWIGTMYRGGPPDAVAVVLDGAIAGQSLRYSNIDIPSLVREIRFYSRELGSERTKYWATWVGRLDDVSGTTSPLHIHFGNFTIGYATFRIYEGKLWVRSTAELGSQYESVGNVVPQAQHTVIVTIDNHAGTFLITLLQRGGSTISVGPRPLGSRSLLTERRLDIQVRFDGSSHSGASYVIDHVIISEVEPDME